MRTIDRLLDEYGQDHQNKTNKKIHWICVPAIFFSLVGLIGSIPAGPLSLICEASWMNWAFITLLLVIVYYVRLSIPLAIGMLFVGISCMVLAEFLASYATWPLWKISIGIFVVAWIGQFIGHKIEGKKPSFIKDIQFLLVGPAWLLQFIYVKLKIKY